MLLYNYVYNENIKSTLADYLSSSVYYIADVFQITIL